MTALKTCTKSNQKQKFNLIKDYPQLYAKFFEKVQKSFDEFFQNDYQCRLIGITINENLFFYGDEYFVNKIPVNDNSSITTKLSGSIISELLDNSLGPSNQKFELNKLTNIEANLIKSFTLFIYKNIETYIKKEEINPKIIKEAQNYNFTFYVRINEKHIGKLILIIPEYLIIKDEEETNPIKNFDISDFKDVYANINVGVGSTKITLNEIKAIEDGDIIVLENSDITEMSILYQEKQVKFKINPNPSLILKIDNNGGNEMEEQTSIKPQNMWDSILVDVVAEFDNVKLTLGELKQISEGLVIDVGSIYDNKIKLRVENQVIATGELVILNDRYGVRIDNVEKSKETNQKQTKTNELEENINDNQEVSEDEVSSEETASDENNQGEQQNGDENFDYSDFEIEDESI